MADANRRSFLKWCIHGLGAVFTVILGAPAAAYLIDSRNRKAPEGDLRPVRGIRLGETEVGNPVQGVIRDIRYDAWTLHPNDVIGRVWIVRTKPGKGSDCFQVFTTECPHLGCSINRIPGNGIPGDPGEETFFKCPCHEAEYKRDGSRIEREDFTNPAPRPMDSLEIEVERDPDNPDATNRDLLKVRFQKFYQTWATKVARA